MNENSKKRITIAIVIAVVCVVAAIAIIFIPTQNRCGDYNLVGNQYVSAPGQGDYRKDGSNYTWVGCNRSAGGSGGGFFGLFYGGGWGGSGGSNSRGGGPGVGK